MTPAPISVERLRELLDKATPGPWDEGTGNFVTLAACHPDNRELIAAAVNSLPALLHQLEEMEAEVESTLACNRGLVRLNEAVTARAESAQRAREEATGLLREVEPEINELSNIYYSEFSNTKREKETEALHSRIAAFLAASGGKDNG